MTARRRQLRHQESSPGSPGGGAQADVPGTARTASNRARRPRAGSGARTMPIDPTPAIDTVLDRAAWSIGWEFTLPLLGFVAATALALLEAHPEITAPRYGGENWVLTLLGLTVLFGALALGVGWLLVRSIADAKRATGPDRRRCLLGVGTIRLKNRREGRFWRATLTTPRGERIVLEQGELWELATGAAPDPANVPEGGLSTWVRGGQVNHWTIPNGRMLYHLESATVLELCDAHGTRLYRHPRYRPAPHDDPLAGVFAEHGGSSQE